MKQLFPIVIACLFAISTQAQTNPAGTPPPSKDPTPQATPAPPAPSPTAPAPVPVEQATKATPVQAHDGVMMKDGKMWVTKRGTTTFMKEEMTLNDGTKVMPDGSYTTKDGKKMMMKNGDTMDMDGKITKADEIKKAPEPKAVPNK